MHLNVANGENNKYELNLVEANFLVLAEKFLQSVHSYSQDVYSEEETYLCFEAKQDFLTRLILVVEINSEMKEWQHLSVLTPYLPQDLQTLQNLIQSVTPQNMLCEDNFQATYWDGSWVAGYLKFLTSLLHQTIILPGKIVSESRNAPPPRKTPEKPTNQPTTKKTTTPPPNKTHYQRNTSRQNFFLSFNLDAWLQWALSLCQRLGCISDPWGEAPHSNLLVPSRTLIWIWRNPIYIFIQGCSQEALHCTNSVSSSCQNFAS